MTDISSNISESFLNNFPEIFHSPQKVNDYLQKHSKNIEKLIIEDFINLGLENDFAIYANGGFGRQELYPSSDIDLSIIQKKKNINDSDNLEKFIAKLWDLGLQVGHSVRTIKDIKKIAKEDPKEFTSYLTRRALLTSKKTDESINLALKKIWTKKKFFKVKLVEQEERYKSFFSTEYNLEPNLKESPGSLRDFQTSLWILQHCFDLKNIDEIKKSKEFGEEIEKVLNSYNFVKAMRYITNIISNKNRLTFEIQVDIAEKAKLQEGTTKRSVEKLMQKFYENASNLSNFNNLVFEKFKEQNQFAITKNFGDFYVRGNKIGFKKNTNLANQRELIFDIFIAIGLSKKINAVETSSMSLLKNNLNLIDENFRNDQVYASKFLEILKSQFNLSSILKSMKSIGVIQKYIPEFDEVIGQMQFDLFHVYTVDEHTFKVVRNMRQMHIHFEEEFKLEYELINKLPKIEILYLAGLFHDLGKGKGGDHSKIGAKTSLDFAKKIGLSKADADLISWLVLNHLEMSSISQKKDISDPDTISAFADLAITTERLDYLYLLTINDIRATNPALWNGWKHGLLRDLFLLTRSKLNKEPIKTIKEISEDRRKNALKHFTDLNNKKEIQDYFKLFDDSYFSKNNLSRLKWQSDLILDASNGSSVIGCRKCFGNLLEIFIKTDNADGLFLKLVEVLEISGLEIIDANISTSTNKTIAANTFITKFSYHDRVLSKSEVKDLQLKIHNNFNNFLALKKNILKKKKNVETFNKKINITNVEETAKKRNLLTIETSDSPGLLIKIAKVLHENGTSIYSARINTLGDRVEDTFEIEDMTLSSVSSDKIQKISASLKETI
jgi:[protein-PII] uridylyltransferase